MPELVSCQELSVRVRALRRPQRFHQRAKVEHAAIVEALADYLHADRQVVRAIGPVDRSGRPARAPRGCVMRRKRALDIASLLTLPLGIVIVLAAQWLEGGAPRALLQGPAALIVFGGTCAAVLVSYSPREVRRS